GSRAPGDVAMTESLWDLALATVRDRAASDAPTPGGGSIAVVSGTLGLALVLMALRVSARRPESGDALAPLIEAGDRLLATLSAQADADILVFEGYMAALKLPRATEEEKAARRAALAQATVEATEMPLNAAQALLEGLDIARQAVPLAHPTIVSDVAAGAALLHGAATAVLYNVDVNLASLKDADQASDYRRSRRHLQRAADDRYAAIREAVAARLTGGT